MENPSNMSCKQMYTCTQVATALKHENQTLNGKEACQTSTHIVCQVQCGEHSDFNCQNPLYISNQKQNFAFPFQYEQASFTDDQFIFSSFDWLVRDLNYGLWPVTVEMQNCKGILIFLITNYRYWKDWNVWI